jgi:hypothetical protein
MICQRCGREQPAPFSPCPECNGLLGSASSIPHPLAATDGNGSRTRTPVRGGDAEPSKPLTLAFARAHHGWAEKHAPWLLEEWLA